MRFLNLMREFLSSNAIGGFVLLGATVVSLIVANSAVGPEYVAFWHRHLNLSFAGLHLDYPIELWINDGLMAIFFLLVGLEIERELYDGELSTLKAAAMPLAAALGGMLVPALIYVAVNIGESTIKGFGVPMATDIAFALGMLSLLGNRVPASLKVFVTALAIIDDIGAILVIAFFYSGELSFTYLGIALAIFGALLLMNRLGVNRAVFYLLPGVAMWYCMHQSGVHATLSGVMLAFALPFREDARLNISEHIQHVLHKPVSFIIVPLFALANTAIPLNASLVRQLMRPYSLGIMLGLLVGKPTGIFLFSYLSVRLGWAYKSRKLLWKTIFGGAIFGGIGFTMSIFIANIAFPDAATIGVAKLSILLTSVVVTLLGLAVMYSISKKAKPA